MHKPSSPLASLVVAGLFGGLVGAGIVLLLVSDGGNKGEPDVAATESSTSESLWRLHLDLERLIALEEQPRQASDLLRHSAREEAIPTKPIPEGLVPALASLEEALRSLPSLHTPDGKSLGERSSIQNVGQRPSDRLAQMTLVTELNSNPDSTMDRYFGATMAQIYALLGRPDRAGTSDGGAYWVYHDIGENRDYFSFWFLDGIVYSIDK